MGSCATVRQQLFRRNQEHLLEFYDELSPERQSGLLAQIGRIDFDLLDGLIRTHVLASPEIHIPPDLAPAPIVSARGAVPDGPPAGAKRLGEDLIAAGKVAAVVVAGGAGTRLGFDGPKGCLPVTPVKRKTLFETFAEQLLATGRRWGASIPWYIMTSPSNDAVTREFFEANAYFGLTPEDVVFFAQGQMPVMGFDGRILLTEKDQIALSPDGHGGCLIALRRSGALDDMAGRGIEQISYFQVDNPLVRCVDPLFIGLHAERGAQMSAKALPKRDPMERVGNFCLADGKVTVIEYSDLPDELARATGPDGALRFNAGSIGIHVFARQFIEELTEGGVCRLPFHRAVKEVDHVGPTGQALHPTEPNAVKLEQFIFDAFPLAETVVLLETVRAEEFSPVKKATGADSLITCLHDQVARAAGWLESVGVAVPRDAAGQVAATIEISPLLALEAGQFAGAVDAGLAIGPDDKLYLGPAEGN